MSRRKEHAEFHYPFGELDIQLSDITTIMGYSNPEDIPQPVQQAFMDICETHPKTGTISGSYLTEPAIVDTTNNKIQCCGMDFDTGRIVARQLKGSETFAWFICTAGKELSESPRKYYEQGEDIKGYTLDVMLNLYLEKALDRFQVKLLEDMQGSGMKITNRYSPGYCEWDVTEQRKLFSLFPEDSVDVKLSDSCLMIPVKSVSGVIGIGKDVRFNEYTCSFCSDKNCLYRKTRTET